MQIDVIPPLGDGEGNETPFAFGSPYRRVRHEAGKGYFVRVKGKRVPIESYLLEAIIEGVMA